MPQNAATGSSGYSNVPITSGGLSSTAPIFTSTGLHVNNEMYAWSYVVFTFIIFSVAFAIMRNLFRNYTGRKNIKKEIKKRMKRALGDDIEGEQREDFLRNEDGPRNSAPEEEKKSSDDNNSNGGINNFFKVAYKKIT